MERLVDKSVRHVMPGLRGGWVVMTARASRAAKTFKTKEAAIRNGRHLAQREHGTLYIHKADGSILEKRTFEEPSEPARA